jgi:hypothetical protein
LAAVLHKGLQQIFINRKELDMKLFAMTAGLLLLAVGCNTKNNASEAKDFVAPQLQPEFTCEMASAEGYSVRMVKLGDTLTIEQSSPIARYTPYTLIVEMIDPSYMTDPAYMPDAFSADVWCAQSFNGDSLDVRVVGGIVEVRRASIRARYAPLAYRVVGQL